MTDVIPMGGTQPLTDADRELAARQTALSYALGYPSAEGGKTGVELAQEYYDFITAKNN